MKICMWPVLILGLISCVQADGLQDNIPEKVRPIPPVGIELPAAVQKELAAGVKTLGEEIQALRKSLKTNPARLELLPDVQIFHNAVRYALAYKEFFNAAEIEKARKLLKEGRERAMYLRGETPSFPYTPWMNAAGLVVRGYVSKIDGSVQPYGLVVPASYRPGTPFHHRLDIWFHGRNERLSEVNFLSERQKSPGPFTPKDTFVLHPYGRFCNANHFAGEIDTFEALEHVRKHYPIDENRLVVRGFSMGGAACWHFAVHHAGLWAAAAPGAGFSETPDFLRVFQNEMLNPPWYEKKLWHMYDCTDYALNLFQCPVVAYSGEKDRQKQAADIMERALAKEGMTLVHIIGPGTEHSYHPAAKKEIDRRIDSIAAKGRNPVPKRIRFTTWTLRYNRMLWVTIDGMEKHWERARVDAGFDNPFGSPFDAHAWIVLKTKNINALTLSMPPGWCPIENDGRALVRLDDYDFRKPVLSDRSLKIHFRKGPKGWQEVSSANDGTTLRKRHGLQGPIDDAFMDSFLIVRPTGKAIHEKVGKWAAAEMAHAAEHWRRQFRGEAPVKDDRDVTDDDIANNNLILWGDPGSNKILARIAAKRLPLQWDSKSVHCGKKTYDAGHHVPVLIFPNPLNPKRYVVLNSGFTFREYDYLNNARQVPKLPDYAVLDVDIPPTSRSPAGIVDAGFFTEQWELP